MSMMFFHFLKIIFDISTSKRSKTYKLYSSKTNGINNRIILSINYNNNCQELLFRS
ncbi:hypothetical protein Peur_041774 [Populus x canadensis]